MTTMRNSKPNAKIRAEDVRQILAELEKGVDPRPLSLRYDVSIETIRRIRRGDTWANIPGRPGDGHKTLEELRVEGEKRAAELMEMYNKGLNPFAKDTLIPEAEWTDLEKRQVALRIGKPTYEARAKREQAYGPDTPFAHPEEPKPQERKIPPNPMENPELCEAPPEDYTVPEGKLD